MILFTYSLIYILCFILSSHTKYKIFVYFLAPATVSGIQKMLDKNSEPKIYSIPLQDSVQLRVPTEPHCSTDIQVSRVSTLKTDMCHVTQSTHFDKTRESARMQRNRMSHTLLEGKVALLLNQTHTNYIIQQSYFWVFTREIKTYLHTKPVYRYL